MNTKAETKKQNASIDSENHHSQFLGNLVKKSDAFTRLSEMMRGGSLPKLILIQGPKNSGKEMLAKVLSRYLFCEREQGKGDLRCKCASCLLPLEEQERFEEHPAEMLDQFVRTQF